MKTLMISLVLIAFSIACKAQCGSSATKYETIQFINKALSNYASGNLILRYDKYSIDLLEVTSQLLIIRGTATSALRESVHGDSKIYKEETIIPLNNLSGNVSLRPTKGYTLVEISTADGKETIIHKGNGVKDGETRNSSALLSIRNDDNMPQRLKEAFEHLFCLLGKKKDKF